MTSLIIIVLVLEAQCRFKNTDDAPTKFKIDMGRTKYQYYNSFANKSFEVGRNKSKLGKWK